MIEDAIQLLGYLALQLATFGKYGRIRPEDSRLLEGAVGFALVVAAMYVIYRVSS